MVIDGDQWPRLPCPCNTLPNVGAMITLTTVQVPFRS